MHEVWTNAPWRRGAGRRLWLHPWPLPLLTPLASAKRPVAMGMFMSKPWAFEAATTMAEVSLWQKIGEQSSENDLLLSGPLKMPSVSIAAWVYPQALSPSHETPPAPPALPLPHQEGPSLGIPAGSSRRLGAGLCPQNSSSGETLPRPKELMSQVDGEWALQACAPGPAPRCSGKLTPRRKIGFAWLEPPSTRLQ